MLGAQGCVLQGRARPYFCRLYPFWVVPPDHLQVFSYNHCLAQKEHRTLHDLCRALGTDPDHLQQLFERLCRAWGLG